MAQCTHRTLVKGQSAFLIVNYILRDFEPGCTETLAQIWKLTLRMCTEIDWEIFFSSLCAFLHFVAQQDVWNEIIETI